MPLNSEVRLNGLWMTAFSTAQINAQRSHFPALEHNHYFNFGGQGPLPQPALDEIVNTYQYLQQVGPFSGKAYLWMMDRVERLRSSIASELSVEPSTISLTESVSGGCNIAMWGVNWKKGDRLLITDCEHQTVFAVGDQLTHRYGIEVDVFPLLDKLNGDDVANEIAALVHPQTKMIVVSHLLWNTGQVLDLKAIAKTCRAANPECLIVVDAAQSVGILPLALGEYDIDAYAFTGHKWWCGPDGLGGLYVPSQSLEKFEPTFIGWRGITLDSLGRPSGWQPDGRRFEVATSAFPVAAGLQAALDLHRSFGTVAQCYERICQLSAMLWQGLNDIPGISCLTEVAPESGLVSFTIDGMNHNHLKFASELAKQGYLTRSLHYPNCARACVHYFTLESEVDALLLKIQQGI